MSVKKKSSVRSSAHPKARQKIRRKPGRQPRSAKDPLEFVSLKWPRSTQRKAIALAKQHTDGNLSAWVRAAALLFRPARGVKLPIDIDMKPAKAA